MKKFARTTAFVLAFAMFITGVPVSASAESSTVILGGQPFGVKFYNDGVMVIELEEFFNGSHYVCPAKEGGLQVDDVIKKVNGIEIKTNEDLQETATGCGGKGMSFIIERDGKELCKTVKPQANTVGTYLLGAWVRDSCAGIGTVTYYNPDNNYFAALGHGICDRDTGAMMPLGEAEIVGASISSVEKSSTGKAGSLNGYFTDKTLGTVTNNTINGIYGTIIDNSYLSGDRFEIAEFDEIQTGDAQIITTISGDRPESYDLKITSIRNDDPRNNENFVIKVTDKRLLDECGGIVQGMSGSPIVQNGKLIGAVTHVFLNNPEEGYGVAAQFMVCN
ncbi:SpoIVB peptidase [Ruminococcus sp. JE7B6]|uniref:SpoIVB peptidase n=1 Tax=Ruminococcus sp. JE7B6 TaxID=3233380 RepID=UPI00389B1FE4